MFWSQSSDLYVLYFHNEPPGNVTNQIREQKGWYTSYYSFSTPGIWKSSKVPTRYKLNLIRCNIKQDFRIQFLYQICSRYVVYDIFCRNTQSSLLQFTRLTLLCTGLMYFVTVSFIIIGHLGSWVRRYGLEENSPEKSVSGQKKWIMTDLLMYTRSDLHLQST